MELNLIKSQVNPHFLFNTLNNIDILIEKDKEKASSISRNFQIYYVLCYTKPKQKKFQ